MDRLTCKLLNLGMELQFSIWTIELINEAYSITGTDRYLPEAA